MSKKKVNSSLNIFEGKVFPLADKKRLHRGKKTLLSALLFNLIIKNYVFRQFLAEIRKICFIIMH
jgi:hypothetical protein